MYYSRRAVHGHEFLVFDRDLGARQVKIAGDNKEVARTGNVRVHDAREPGIANRIPRW